MIFLHGGVICPAELAALAASMPFVLALLHYASCRCASWYERTRRTLRRRWPWRKRSKNPYRTPGGAAVNHEATLRIRVTPAGPADYKRMLGRTKRK